MRTYGSASPVEVFSIACSEIPFNTFFHNSLARRVEPDRQVTAGPARLPRSSRDALHASLMSRYTTVMRHSLLKAPDWGLLHVFVRLKEIYITPDCSLQNMF